MSMQNFQKFVPLMKVEDGIDGLATEYGIITAEVADKDGEVCDYESTVPLYRKWSEEFMRTTNGAGQQLSLGNVRLMHGLTIAGKITKIDFLDDKKQIWTGSTAVNAEISNMLRGGYLTGKSQGGRYLWRRCEVCKTSIDAGNFCPECKKKVLVRYCAEPSENSYVDNPCLGIAHFAYVKANGSSEMRKFATKDQTEQAIIDAAEIGRLAKDSFSRAIELLKTNGFPVTETNETFGGMKVHILPAITKEQARGRFGTTQISIDPAGEIGKAFAVLRDAIKGEDLMAGGLETEPHVTVRYGIQDAETGALRTYLESLAPFTITFGKTASFDPSPSSDGAVPIIIKIVSEDLRRINTEIASHANFKSADFEYTPHATLGYVKPESAAQYVDNAALEGAEYEVTSITISPKEGMPQVIALGSDLTPEQSKASSADGLVKLFEEIEKRITNMDSPLVKTLEDISGRLGMLSKANLRKSMYQVADLACLLQQIQNLQAQSAWEGEIEHDEGDLAMAEEFGVWLTQGIAILKRLVDHETSEMVAPAE